MSGTRTYHVPQIELNDLIPLGVNIKKLKSCEILVSGEYVGTLIVPDDNPDHLSTVGTRSNLEQLAFSEINRGNNKDLADLQ
jgi:hypothetical protein